jgi:Fe-S-cluster containining protein
MFSMDLPQGVVKRLVRTIDEINDTKSIDAMELISKIYKTVDFYYKHAVEKHASCSKGCSWCCRVPLDVSAIEVQYINERTGINVTELEKGKDWSRTPDKTKCPFLKDSQCSIYPYRPFNCRVFASLDGSENCIDGNTKYLIYTWESSQGLKVLKGILTEASEQSPLATYGDIREWFGAGKIKARTEK